MQVEKESRCYYLLDTLTSFLYSYEITTKNVYIEI